MSAESHYVCSIGAYLTQKKNLIKFTLEALPDSEISNAETWAEFCVRAYRWHNPNVVPQRSVRHSIPYYIKHFLRNVHSRVYPNGNLVIHCFAQLHDMMYVVWPSADVLTISGTNLMDTLRDTVVYNALTELPEVHVASKAADAETTSSCCWSAVRRPRIEMNAEFPLRDDQLHTLETMLERENSFRVHSNYNSEKLADKCYVNFQGTQIDSFTEDPDVRSLPVQFRGGLLTNETGSGKTAIVLALASTTPPLTIPRTRQNYDGFYPVHATLIIVPVNLLHQWKCEIQKFLAGPVNVVCIADLRHFKKLKVQHIVEADIVLLSSNFAFSNKKYLSMVQSSFVEVEPDAAGLVFNLTHPVQKQLFGKMAQEYTSETRCPPLEIFRFERVVIDEIHEQVAAPARNSTHFRNFKHKLKALQYKNLWGLTATPKIDHLHQLRNYVDIFSDGWFQQSCLPTLPKILPALIICVEGPVLKPFKTFVHVIHPTQRERGIILAQPSLPLSIQASSSFLAVESATPGGSEELCDNLQTAVKKLLSFNKNKIARLREQESCLQRMIESGVQSNRANDAAAINRLVDRQGLVQDEIKKLTQTLNFLQTTVVSAKKECPVCMVAECDAMFSCGHTHCQVCSRILMSSTQPRCSICRCDLSSQKMFLIGQSDDFLVNKYGSKFPCILEQTKKCFEHNESVVIFTQWTRMMRLLAAMFQEKNMDCLQLSGNHACRTKTIQKFRSTERPSVLILSLLDSNSGLDLCRANNVFFAHAIDNSAVTELEQQAIARCHRIGQLKDVNVRHFITAQSPESSLFFEHSRPLVNILQSGEITTAEDTLQAE